MLRKVFSKSTGVGLGAFMEEKLRNKVIKTGLITMKGDLKVHNNNTDDAACCVLVLLVSF